MSLQHRDAARQGVEARRQRSRRSRRVTQSFGQRRAAIIGASQWRQRCAQGGFGRFQFQGRSRIGSAAGSACARGITGGACRGSGGFHLRHHRFQRGNLGFGSGRRWRRGGCRHIGRGRGHGFSRGGAFGITPGAAAHTRHIARHHRRDFTGTRVQAGPIIGSAGATDQQKGKNKRLGHAVHDLSPKTARKRLQCPARMAIRPAFTVCARSSAG